MGIVSIPDDLDARRVEALHRHIGAAIDDWQAHNAGSWCRRMVITALLADVCGITQDAPEEVRAAIAEEAVHFIMTNSGADARDVFDVHRKRHEADKLAAVEPMGSA